MKKLYIIFICLILSTSVWAYDNSHNRTGVDVDDAVERALVPRTDIRDESIASDNQLPTEKAVARAINLIPNATDINHTPTSTDDENAGYLVGDVVRNTSDNNRLYMCKSNLANNAVWQEIGGVVSESDPIFVASPAHSITDSGSNQVITSTERTKLSGIENNATANSTDAVLLSRSNHTGTQTASTISDFDTEVSNNPDVTANTSHRGDTNNPHSTNKTHVGLGNVDNTSDADKPVSTATQTALDLKQNRVTGTCAEGSSIRIIASDGTVTCETDDVGSGGGDTDAIHDNIASEISAIALKGTPVSADMLIIEDSADSNNKKRITVGSLPSGGGDFTGPASSTDNALIRFDGTTGKIGENSGVILDDNDSITGLSALSILNSGGGTVLSASNGTDADITVGIAAGVTTLQTTMGDLEIGSAGTNLRLLRTPKIRSSAPGIIGYDSNGGSTEWVGQLYWNYIDGGAGAENADLIFSVIQGGSNTEILRFDESDDRWEIPTGKGLAFGSVQWDNGSDYIDGAAIEADGITSLQLGVDSVSSSELDATGVESELEGVIDLQDLQGAVTASQLPTYTQQIEGLTPTANYLLGINSGGTAYELKSSISVELTGFSNSMAVVSDSTGKLESDANVSATELGYSDGAQDGSNFTNFGVASDDTWNELFAAIDLNWPSGSGAPTDAHYYVNLANATLSAEVVVTGLETVNGLGKADGSGAWSAATDGTDYWSPASDGSGSGLDADTMDGHDTSYFQTDLTDSASLRSALSDESGTGAALFAGGNIGASTATTPSADDNDTSVPTTAWCETTQNYLKTSEWTSASTTAEGKVELATGAEAVTGTDTTRAVTPDALTDRMATPGTIGGTTPGAINGTTGTYTGTLSGEIGVTLDTAATIDLSTASNARGQMRINNDNDVIDYTLPPAESGLNICFYSRYAAVVTIDVDDTADTIVLDGTALTAGNAIDSPGTAGDFICMMAIDGTYWLTLGRSGTWVDGGAD